MSGATKVCVITGGTSGIGRACAERFVAEGWAAVVAGRNRETGEVVATELGERALFVRADITEPDDIKGLVATAIGRFGRIDGFVSNAGTPSATGSVLDADLAAFDHDIALHVRAPLLAMKYAAPSMIERGSGSFINMSSISGVRAGFNTFGYEVAKAALAHLTRCAALELGERGVRVNSISPGPTLTPIFGRHVGGEPDGSAQARLEQTFLKILPTVQAQPGMIQARDIAAAAFFLASDDARFVNGHDLVVDGGITAGQPASVMRASWQVLAEALTG